MALGKAIILQDGVSVDYHRIARIDKIINVQNILEISSYISQEAREKERKCLSSKVGEMNIYINTSIYNLPYNPDTTPETAYLWIKDNVAEFEGAIDVFDDGQEL